MPTRKEQFLIFRIYHSQDDEAYAELRMLYLEKIRRFIYFRVPRSEDADDLTAEVFLRGWEYATSTKIENPGAVFYRIARNLVADFYRTRGTKEVELEAAATVVDQSVGASESMAKQQEFEALMKKLALLKEEYRDIISMRFLDEMSIEEIASALDKKPANVRTLLYRATKALRIIALKES